MNDASARRTTRSGYWVQGSTIDYIIKTLDYDCTYLYFNSIVHISIASRPLNNEIQY